MLRLLLNGAHQVVLCFFACKAGNAFQRAQLLVADAPDLLLGALRIGQPAAQLLALAFYRVVFLVEAFLLLVKAALQLLDLVAPLLDLPVGFGT